MDAFMRSLWAIALAGAVSTASAWTISSTASPPPGGEHKSIAKTWTIAGADALQTLTVQSMGRVFIDYDASLGDALTAKVVVSGDASDLLDAIEVVDDISTNEEKATGVKIHFQNDAFEGQGHLLTQVYVSTKHALRNVTMAWSSDVVVGDDVLVQNDRDATVGLSLTGSGTLYAGSPSTQLTLGALGVSLLGSGRIQLLAKSVSVANTIEMNVDGTGDIAATADRITVDGTLSSYVHGSGDVFVQSNNLSTRELSLVSALSGSITCSHAGTCNEQTVILIGSGDVSTASIVCAKTSVSLAGSGDVFVQSTESLTVESLFRGDVEYFGAAPKIVKSSSLFGDNIKKTKEIVRSTNKYTYEEYEAIEVPERTPVYVMVQAAHGSEGDEPLVSIELELAALNERLVRQFIVQHRLQERVTTKNAWASLGLAGVVVAVMTIVVVIMHARRRRHQYQSL